MELVRPASHGTGCQAAPPVVPWRHVAHQEQGPGHSRCDVAQARGPWAPEGRCVGEAGSRLQATRPPQPWPRLLPEATLQRHLGSAVAGGPRVTLGDEQRVPGRCSLRGGALKMGG